MNTEQNPWEPKQDHLRLMEDRLRNPPKLLTRWAGNDGCSIFRVPSKFYKTNSWTYVPHIVSIGPYHIGLSNLNMFQEHKWVYLKSTLHRTNLKLEDLMKAIQPLMLEAKECYSEDVSMDGDEFMEIMLLDGCFILELFHREAYPNKETENDPIFTMLWVLASLAEDLLKLENQIPYCILHRLFEIIRMDGPSLPLLALGFFSRVSGKPDNVNNSVTVHEWKHLLDLVRKSYINGFPKSLGTYKSSRERQRACKLKKWQKRFGELKRQLLQNLVRRLFTYRNEEEHIASSSIYNADDRKKSSRGSQKDYQNVLSAMSKLSESGIKPKHIVEGSFLWVNFRNGMLQMPTITFSASMVVFLQNCIAYEQCLGRTNLHFTTYAVLLDCLVDTKQDVDYFCEEKIFENLLGSMEEIVSIINGLCNNVSYNLDSSYLCHVFKEIEKYNQNPWHRYWTSFKSIYMKTPWIFLSTLAAVILLLLTFLQTFYTIFGYHNSRSK